MKRAFPSRTRSRPSSREALTILEVLVSIGLLTLGLLGVVVLIPIAAQKIRRGMTLDDSTVTARNGKTDFQAREGNNIRKWLRYQPGAFAAPAAGTMNGLWGVQMQTDPYPANNNTASAYVKNTWAFCIDPMMYESSILQNTTDRQPNFFPYQPQAPTGGVFPTTTEVRFGLPSLSPIGVPTGNRGRMMRVTMNWSQVDWRPYPPIPLLGPASLNVGLANSMCVSTDDLLLTAPGQEPSEGMLGLTVAQADAPASQSDFSMQSWDDPLTLRVKRNFDGRLSWFATMVPLQGGVSGGQRYYTLSVAVVERRDMVVDASRETTIDSTMEELQAIESERTAGVRFIGGGLGGGEIQLFSYQTTPELGLKNLSRLREGNWILISGPVSDQVSSPAGGSSFIYYWYRIGSIDPQPTIVGGQAVRNATLRGPDWPAGVTYLPAFPVPVGEATIVSNVINVFEQTIELRGE